MYNHHHPRRSSRTERNPEGIIEGEVYREWRDVEAYYAKYGVSPPKRFGASDDPDSGQSPEEEEEARPRGTLPQAL